MAIVLTLPRLRPKKASRGSSVLMGSRIWATSLQHTTSLAAILWPGNDGKRVLSTARFEYYSRSSSHRVCLLALLGFSSLVRTAITAGFWKIECASMEPLAALYTASIEVTCGGHPGSLSEQLLWCDSCSFGRRNRNESPFPSSDRREGNELPVQ